MAGDWNSGLTDSDDLSQFPSAASQLGPLGLDPDMVRANPEMMASLSASSRPAASESAPPPKPAPEQPSAIAAGKVGDAESTPPTAPPPQPAAPATPPDAQSYGMEGLGLLSKSAKMAQDADAAIPTTDTEAPKLQALRDKLAVKPALFDTKTGKRLKETQEYDPDTGQPINVKSAPSVGQRIWRGVRGGLVGMSSGKGALLGALDPGAVGSTPYGAPSDAFQRAEERRTEQLASTDNDIANNFKTFKEAQVALKARASDSRANAALGKDLTTGATGMMNSATAAKKADAEATKAANETPEAKARLNQQEFDQRGQRLATDPQLAKLSPLNKILYRLNGKVPDPREPNEAEINAAAAARALVVFQAQHGGKGPQTLEDFNSIQQAARGEMGKGQKSTTATPEQVKQIADKKNKAIEDANAGFAKNADQQEYQTQLQEAQNAFEEDAGVLGVAGPHQQVIVDKDGHVTWKPIDLPSTPPPNAPAPSAQAAGALGGAGAPKPPAAAQPAPDGTRRQSPSGTIEVKRGGKWVAE